MRHRLWVVSLLVLVLLGFISPTYAADSWCKADPIVRMNGTRVQFLTAIPQQYVHLVDGPIRFEIKTPQSVRRELIFTDSGFNGGGEDFSWSDLGDGYRQGAYFDIKVKVLINIKTSATVPVRVEVIPENGPTLVFQGTHKGTEFMTLIKSTK